MKLGVVNAWLELLYGDRLHLILYLVGMYGYTVIAPPTTILQKGNRFRGCRID